MQKTNREQTASLARLGPVQVTRIHQLVIELWQSFDSKNRSSVRKDLRQVAQRLILGLEEAIKASARSHRRGKETQKVGNEAECVTS